MKAVIAAIPRAESDPNRPVYHFHAPANWSNDPNGPFFYKGWYHLFYQHNPFAAVWGHMHWGHARSRDLVNWEHLPIALWPSRDQGEEHCFSGGAVLAADNSPRLIYTSIGNRDPQQWMAIPRDDALFVWEKYPRNPILTLGVHGGRKIYDWRDPFLFREAGSIYMVCGGNINGRRQGGGAEVQLYEAVGQGLNDWKYRGDVFAYLDREVINIECPNLFKLGARWVLLCSPNKNCEYLVGDLDVSSAKFVPRTRGVLDAGDAYASNILHDRQGRSILWLWGRTHTNPANGWNGCMAIPRILTLDEAEFLRQSPYPGFEVLRGDVHIVAPAVLSDKPLNLGKRTCGDCLEFQAELSAEMAAGVGLRVRCVATGEGGTEISFAPKTGVVTVANMQKLIGRQQPLRLRVFLDKCALEVYVNDGLAAIFTTIDGGPNDLAIAAFAKGGTARLDSFKMWTLRPARFSLKKFKVQ